MKDFVFFFFEEHTTVVGEKRVKKRKRERESGLKNKKRAELFLRKAKGL